MSIFAQRRAYPRPHFLSDRARHVLGAVVCGALLFFLALLVVEYPHGLGR